MVVGVCDGMPSVLVFGISVRRTSGSATVTTAYKIIRKRKSPYIVELFDGFRFALRVLRLPAI
jgi:hypothetical protein